MTIAKTLEDAAENGEFVTIIYGGGHTPGYKRRILPRRITDTVVYARESDASKVKTFRLDRMQLCSDDDPAPWLPNVSGTRNEMDIVEPSEAFSDWAYGIEKYHWSIFGIAKREYVDKPKTEAARAAAVANGVSKEEAKKISIKHLVYSMPKEQYDFHEGDLFYSQEGPYAVQVIGIREFIEAHYIIEATRRAYQVTDAELAEWLHSGKPPIHARIGPDESYSDTLRFSIQQAVPTRDRHIIDQREDSEPTIINEQQCTAGLADTGETKS